MFLPSTVQVLCSTWYREVDLCRILMPFVSGINRQEEYCLSLAWILLTSRYQSVVDDRMKIKKHIQCGKYVGIIHAELSHCPVMKDQWDYVLSVLEERGGKELFLKISDIFLFDPVKNAFASPGNDQQDACSGGSLSSCQSGSSVCRWRTCGQTWVEGSSRHHRGSWLFPEVYHPAVGSWLQLVESTDFLVRDPVSGELWTYPSPPTQTMRPRGKLFKDGQDLQQLVLVEGHGPLRRPSEKLYSTEHWQAGLVGGRAAHWHGAVFDRTSGHEHQIFRETGFVMRGDTRKRSPSTSTLAKEAWSLLGVILVQIWHLETSAHHDVQVFDSQHALQRPGDDGFQPCGVQTIGRLHSWLCQETRAWSGNFKNSHRCKHKISHSFGTRAMGGGCTMRTLKAQDVHICPAASRSEPTSFPYTCHSFGRSQPEFHSSLTFFPCADLSVKKFFVLFIQELTSKTCLHHLPLLAWCFCLLMFFALARTLVCARRSLVLQGFIPVLWKIEANCSRATSFIMHYLRREVVLSCTMSNLHATMWVFGSCWRLWSFGLPTHGPPVFAGLVQRGYWPGPTSVQSHPKWCDRRAPTLCGWCSLEVVWSWTCHHGERCVNFCQLLKLRILTLHTPTFTSSTSNVITRFAPLRDHWFAVGARAPEHRSLQQRGLLFCLWGLTSLRLVCGIRCRCGSSVVSNTTVWYSATAWSFGSSNADPRVSLCRLTCSVWNLCFMCCAHFARCCMSLSCHCHALLPFTPFCSSSKQQLWSCTLPCLPNSRSLKAMARLSSLWRIFLHLFHERDAALHYGLDAVVAPSLHISFRVSSLILLAYTCEVIGWAILFISSSYLSFLACSAERVASATSLLQCFCVDHKRVVSSSVPREVRERSDTNIIFWTEQGILELFSSQILSRCSKQPSMFMMISFRVHSMVGLDLLIGRATFS